MHINRSIGISLSVACGLANCLAHGGHSHLHQLQRSAPRDVAEELPQAVSLVRRGLAEVRDLAQRSANSVEVPEEELRGMLDKIKLLEGQVMELLPAEASADSAPAEPALVDPIPTNPDASEGDEQQTGEDEAPDSDSTELSDDETPAEEADTEDIPTDPETDPASADSADAAEEEAPEIAAADEQAELDENTEEAEEAVVSDAAEDGALPLETPTQTEVAGKESENSVTPAGLGTVSKENIDAEESTTTITSTRTVTSTTTVPWVEPNTTPQTTSPAVPKNVTVVPDSSRGMLYLHSNSNFTESIKKAQVEEEEDDNDSDISDEDDDDDDGEDDDDSEDDGDDDDDDGVSLEKVATETPKLEDVAAEGAEADVAEKAALTTDPTTAPAGVALTASEDTPLPAEAIDASIQTTETSPLTEATIDVSSETLKGVTSTPPVTPLAVEEVKDTAESSPTNKVDGSGSPSGFRTVTVPSKADE
jgi:hypothetical protein